MERDGLEIYVMEDVRGFSALQPAWEDLLGDSPADCMFLTWEWLHTWYKHLGRQRKLHIITVWDGATLVALAPLIVVNRQLTRLRLFRTLEFMGAGTVGSDYLDVIVRWGWEDQVAKALVEHFRRGRFMLKLEGTRDGGIASGRLAANLTEGDWSTRETTTNICPFINLAGHSWESYLATLGSEHRYNINRRMRNLYKQFDVSFDLVSTESDREEALLQLVHLHRVRRNQMGGSNAFETEALVSFHNELTSLALIQGWLRLFVMSLDGVPAAALYAFSYAGKFYFYQSGLDMAYAKQSIGLVTMGLAIKRAIEEGANEYDLLQGREPYKFHWTSQSRDLTQLEFYPPGARGLICRTLDRLDGKARKLARQTLPQPLAERLAAFTK